MKQSLWDKGIRVIMKDPETMQFFFMATYMVYGALFLSLGILGLLWATILPDWYDSGYILGPLFVIRGVMFMQQFLDFSVNGKNIT